MNTNDVDARIRAALSAAADTVGESDLRAEGAPTSLGGSVAARRARWLSPLLAAAAVAAVAIGTAAVVSTQRAAKVHPATSVAPSPSPATPTPAPSPSHSRSAASSPKGSPSVQTTAPSGTAVNCYFIDFRCPVTSDYVFLQPLWPFADYADEQAWQAASKSGHQPWHADAGDTALSFAKYYLGFTDITTVTSKKTDDQDAHIGVGYPLPNKQLHTAAVLHLVRYTPTVGDTTAGWEVVGSGDTDFSLEQPAYGSTVTSPMTVGGHITGVDENIVVDVKNASVSVVTGARPSLPAGGQNSPWHASVRFHASGVLTIVVFTGGHLTQHERFAIQGVHT